MKYYKCKHIHKKDLIIAVYLTVAVVAILVMGGLAISHWENNRYAVKDVADYSTNIDATPAPKEIIVDGITYRQRPDVSTYLFIGVDNAGEATGNDSYIGGGQGDVQMVLTTDDANKTWQILQLNRDSIVDVSVLGIRGDVVGSTREQLAMAHSYGDGRQTSCENNVNVVSKLLEGQEIDGYMALNMDGVGILTDMLGGVPVEITSDFTEIDSELQEGTIVTLTGKQALTFVRSRKNVDDETNIARMARQRQFLAALQEQMNQQDAEFTIKAYDALSKYMITNISSGTAEKIAEKLKEYQQQNLLTIEGDNRVEDGHWAYYLDDESLQNVILQMFYQKT